MSKVVKTRRKSSDSGRKCFRAKICLTGIEEDLGETQVLRKCLPFSGGHCVDFSMRQRKQSISCRQCMRIHCAELQKHAVEGAGGTANVCEILRLMHAFSRIDALTSGRRFTHTSGPGT